ncbi:hypothetical protein J8J14_22330 [Roseomonas sp. SSH11]|uniref:Uncharacterized protein n=1 Tax=Pararoseomonas baculiformis TaxID=2820812 RepID=A0ABS4AKC8_9PROT|nr:hypothetical protein [Pararoseomonas baculiformis]MBP0447502.1 hypothetical protein [Pararoseomonas baculiformis]
MPLKLSPEETAIVLDGLLRRERSQGVHLDIIEARISELERRMSEHNDKYLEWYYWALENIFGLREAKPQEGAAAESMPPQAEKA